MLCALIAAAAGCSIKSHETDYDGVDITIVASTEYAKYYCPEFEMQLKCTTQHRLLSTSHLAWPLERDRFLELVSPQRFTPAVLGVLLIPENPDQLLDLSEEGLTSSSRMYWERAANLGEIEDDKATAASYSLSLPGLEMPRCHMGTDRRRCLFRAR